MQCWGPINIAPAAYNYSTEQGTRKHVPGTLPEKLKTSVEDPETPYHGHRNSGLGIQYYSARDPETKCLGPRNTVQGTQKQFKYILSYDQLFIRTLSGVSSIFVTHDYTIS